MGWLSAPSAAEGQPDSRSSEDQIDHGRRWLGNRGSSSRNSEDQIVCSRPDTSTSLIRGHTHRRDGIAGDKPNKGSGCRARHGLTRQVISLNRDISSLECSADVRIKKVTADCVDVSRRKTEDDWIGCDIRRHPRIRQITRGVEATRGRH